MMEKQHGTIWILLLLAGITFGVGFGWMTYTMNSPKDDSINMGEEPVVDEVPLPDRQVSINGVMLPPDVRIALVDGSYWYDEVTGLYGPIGSEAVGLMPLGFEAAPMMKNVSAGKTGVLLNGRDLPKDELEKYNASLDSAMTPGVYYADPTGTVIDENGTELGTVRFGQNRPYGGPPGSESVTTSSPPQQLEQERLF